MKRGFPTLLLAGIGGWLLARTSLAPVVAMADSAQRISGAHLAEFIWSSLVSGVSSGALKNIRVVQTRDLSFDCNG